MSSEVFHGSHEQNLKVIEGSISTHNKKWVYATKDVAIASLFITNEKLGDFGTMMGNFPQTYICERFEGALEQLYGSAKGSIYTLPGHSFKSENETFDIEVVSEDSVVPIEELRVNNNLELLNQFESEGKLKIYRYPSRPSFIPEDDEDIVFKSVIWLKQFGDGTMNALKKYQPHLVDRVIKIVNDEGLQVKKFAEWLVKFEPYKQYLLSVLESDFPEVYKYIKDGNL